MLLQPVVLLTVGFSNYCAGYKVGKAIPSVRLSSEALPRYAGIELHKLHKFVRAEIP